MQLRILLPIPNKKLMPNNKNGSHWSFSNSARKNDKSIAYYETLLASKLQDAKFSKNDQLKLTIDFLYKDKRKRDNDNLIAASKALIDGMCLALKIDDSQIINISSIVKYSENCKGTLVTLEINETQA